MTDLADPHHALLHYLRRAREGLVHKLDGLGERELRLPRTPTGTNLIGLVKHCANNEWNYFGLSFGRTFADEHLLVAMDTCDADPQADWYATETESAAGIVELYGRVAEFADEAIGTLALDTVVHVPWWPADRAEATLLQLVVRVIDDTARHAGHADILRELHDGAIGLNRRTPNLPDAYDWPANVARLTELANRY